ncbi:rod shape-determining protein MreC [Sutterella sp.]|uniref:rod shape-determining protein MreC n=1 Tax=Sutterella sp. TaxID=1981025 RepID=UPI0026E0D425|nr:rod shape-determining protein MreC [Sutterella sp.]MDO5530412.1 rod shape-determining protein MreC [Sutterella sp.]
MEYGAPPLFRQGVSAKAKFIFFLMLSVAAILVDGRLKALDGVRSTIVSFTSPVVEVIHLPGRLISEAEGYFISKRRLNEEVTRLSEENQLLQLKAARYEEVQLENESLRKLLSTVGQDSERISTAEVIGRVADPFSRRIQLNVGDREGVRIGMPVIGPFGVLGQVSRTVSRLSEVTLITDHTMRLSVINRRTGALFVLAGTGESALSVLFALPGADLREGDELVTSGLDRVFPKHVLCATVTSATYQPGEPYLRVEARAVEEIDDMLFATVVLTDPDPAAELKETPEGTRFERRSRR